MIKLTVGSLYLAFAMASARSPLGHVGDGGSDKGLPRHVAPKHVLSNYWHSDTNPRPVLRVLFFGAISTLQGTISDRVDIEDMNNEDFSRTTV